MRRIALLLISLVIAQATFAQVFSGSATYKTASEVPFKMDNPDMTPDQKKMMEERMIKAMQKEYSLEFNRNQSLYSEVQELEKDGSRGPGFMRMFGTSGTFYKDLKTGTYTDKVEFFGKQFLIQDSLEPLQWKLEKGSKAIGKYQCNKATAQRIVQVTKVERVDGVSTDTTVFDTITLTAWYSMQIPVSNGPDQYGGLPGLILELNDGRTTWLCTRVSINPGEEKEIDEPSGGEEVNQQEYNEITAKKMEEMRKMYGDRGGNRGTSSYEIRIGR